MRLRQANVWALALFLLWGSAAEARDFKDAVGRLVKVPENPRAVVSLAPNITEILFAVGAGGQVAGVTDFCDYPPEARGLPRIGGFVNPSLEVVASLGPDLIIGTADGNRPADILRMEKMGLSVYVTDTKNLDDIYGTIRRVGELTGHGEEADELAARMAQRRGEIAARVKDRPKPSVLFLVGWKPMVGVGAGTFIHNLMGEAGGANTLASSPVRYPLISMESLLAADPEVIVLSTMEGGPEKVGTPPGWQGLRAVRGGRVYRLRDDTLLRPGPRVLDALQALSDLFHPGIPAGEAPRP